MLARNALLPVIERVMSRVACALAESVTTKWGVYAPWPPINPLLTFPVFALIDIPSGSGAKLGFVLTEKV